MSVKPRTCLSNPSLNETAADAEGVADILKDGEASGGLMVPRDDPQALAVAIGRILDDPTLAEKLAKCAVERAETAFSLESIGRQLRTSLLRSPLPNTPSTQTPE